MAERNDMIGRLTGVGSLEMKEGSRIKLVVGLGNPGPAYENTRHNVGFAVADALAERFGVRIRRQKFNALAEEVVTDFGKLVLIKPQQYMNRSGHAAATALGFYKLSPAEMLVVTDDMALDVGRLRMRAQGSAGGHNGLKDIIARIGSDQFPRLRIGIGASGQRDAADYVLSRFSADERDAMDKAARTAVEAVLCWAAEGVDIAMTRFNAKSDATDRSEPTS